MLIKIITTLLFFLLLFNFSPVNSVFAQDATTSASPVEKEGDIEYALPYPGLLPDHPLYFLKMVRDNVVGFFISNPLEKAKFSLLQADKRVQASYDLAEKGEQEYILSRDTFSKALNYFDKAIVLAGDARTQGINIDDFSEKLFLANKKHQQMFLNIKNMVKDKKDFSLQEGQERITELGEKAKSINQDK